MNIGRAKVVLCNSLHEASTKCFHDTAVGICDSWETVSPLLLPWTHSILDEPRYYVSPFQAAIKAFTLQWEACADRLCEGVSTLSLSTPPLKSLYISLKTSLKSHSSNFTMKQVRFEDQIDVHLGDDETLEMYIYCSCTECTPELGNETMEHETHA